MANWRNERWTSYFVASYSLLLLGTFFFVPFCPVLIHFLIFLLWRCGLVEFCLIGWKVDYTAFLIGLIPVHTDLLVIAPAPANIWLKMSNDLLFSCYINIIQILPHYNLLWWLLADLLLVLIWLLSNFTCLTGLQKLCLKSTKFLHYFWPKMLWASLSIWPNTSYNLFSSFFENISLATL